MIIVEVHYYLKEGCRETFFNRIVQEGIGDASRNDPGNIKYDYYFSPENGNEILLLEAWESAEGLEKHGAAEHMKKLAALKDAYVLKTSVRKFESEEIY